MKDYSKIFAYGAVVSLLLLVAAVLYYENKTSDNERALKRAMLGERDNERIFDNEAAKTEYYRGFLDGARWRDSNRGANIDSLRKTMNLPKRRHLLKIY